MSQVQAKTYRWIPWVFVGAMAFVVAVNGGLVYFAIREPVGIVVKNPYQDGLRYNEKLAERQKQIALGWQIAAKVSGRSGDTPVEVVVEAKDAAGQPLIGLRGRVRFDRPVEKLPTIEADLKILGPGRYTAYVTLPRPGQWDLSIDLDSGNDRHDSNTRITVP